MRPVMDRISQYGSATEILYKCPRCGASFRILGNQERYCHNCGIHIHWDNVPLHASEKFSKLYHNSDCEKQKLLMDEYTKRIDEFLNKGENQYDKEQISSKNERH